MVRAALFGEPTPSTASSTSLRRKQAIPRAGWLQPVAVSKSKDSRLLDMGDKSDRTTSSASTPKASVGTIWEEATRHATGDKFRRVFVSTGKVPFPDTFTFQGDLYAGQAGDSATVPTPAPPFKMVTNATPELSGGNLLGRWIHKFDSGSESTVQMFYDRTDRRNAFWVLHEVNDTVDVDFQHRFQWGRRHEIVWERDTGTWSTPQSHPLRRPSPLQIAIFNWAAASFRTRSRLYRTK